MSSGTSEKSSPKKRRKRGPNKKTLKDNAELLKGNDNFKLTPEQEVQLVEQHGDLHNAADVFNAVTAEDIALDRQLAEMAKQQETPSDNIAVAEVKKTKENLEHLREFMDNYAPATTLADLTEQIHEAHANGCDSVDATPTLVKQLFRKDYDYIEKNVGYGIYHNIRVYIDGHFDKNKGADRQTMEQRLFQGPVEAKKV